MIELGSSVKTIDTCSPYYNEIGIVVDKSKIGSYKVRFPTGTGWFDISELKYVKRSVHD